MRVTATRSRGGRRAAPDAVPGIEPDIHYRTAHQGREIGFSASIGRVRSGCGTTRRRIAGLPAAPHRRKFAGATCSVLPLTRSDAPLAQAGIRSFIANLPSPGSRTVRHGVRRRIVGVLNDRDLAARTLPGHFRRHEQVDHQRLIVVEVRVQDIVGDALYQGAGAAGPLPVVGLLVRVGAVVRIVRVIAVAVRQACREHGVVQRALQPIAVFRTASRRIRYRASFRSAKLPQGVSKWALEFFRLSASLPCPRWTNCSSGAHPPDAKRCGSRKRQAFVSASNTLRPRD